MAAETEYPLMQAYRRNAFMLTEESIEQPFFKLL